ncbi:MAG: hypothetical protein JRJ14_07480 [Deltaproteobacteria bacterium]|nr:hypothetical protein [Deltaproteobacteria bacterium]
MQSSHNAHVKRLVVFFVIAALLGLVAKMIATPRSFGKYGHYRGDAVMDERDREVRHMTNDSCLACHPYIKEMHLGGIHKTVSCEFCHGPYADHVKDGKKIAALPIKHGEEIKPLWLRCHNQIIRARPKEAIKMISLPQHLEEQHVRTDPVCHQCHNVHAPMMYVNAAREIIGLQQEAE